MDFPKNVVSIIEQANANNPNDIVTAVNDAVARVKRLPEYPDLVDKLVHNSIQELLYDARHRINVQIKRDSGYYGGPAKVSHYSESINRVCASVYAYQIARRQLGKIQGNELNGIAANEDRMADGHKFNADLCRWLAELVPADKLVEQAVSERKLKAKFRKLCEQYSAAA